MNRLMAQREWEREKLGKATLIVVGLLKTNPPRSDAQVRLEARQAFREALNRLALRTTEVLIDSDGRVEKVKVTDTAGVFQVALQMAKVDQTDQARQESLVEFVDQAIEHELAKLARGDDAT
jgi:hypothetical protein